MQERKSGNGCYSGIKQLSGRYAIITVLPDGYGVVWVYGDGWQVKEMRFVGDRIGISPWPRSALIWPIPCSRGANEGFIAIPRLRSSKIGPSRSEGCWPNQSR